MGDLILDHEEWNFFKTTNLCVLLIKMIKYQLKRQVFNIWWKG